MHDLSCDCGSQKEARREECLRTVLECNPPKRDKFTVLQLSAEDKVNLSSWNIALFSDPRHPDLGDVEAMKGVKWLSLDGQTPKERAHLQACLQTLGKIRDREQRQYSDQEHMISRRADRPMQREARRESLAQTSRASSVFSSPSLASEPSRFG